MAARRVGGRRSGRASSENQLNIFRDGIWPAVDEFPHNRTGFAVEEVLDPDLLESEDPLVITGFASLSRLIGLFARWERRRRTDPTAIRRIRVLLGHEPHQSARGRHGLGRRQFDQEVADYWLDRGISLALCAEVLEAKDLLDSGLMEVRRSGRRPVHAKMYVTESAITLGSSNYSRPGLSTQLEANVRFKPSEETRTTNARLLAKAIWAEGKDYLPGLRALLDQLLKWVTWEEALGRACAELLHGDWARRYIPANTLGDEDWLWPTQEEGIAQALWVLENVGSVLVADATGSGKTKMGAHLIRALESRNWRTGRIRKGSPLVICPPAVRRYWRREATRCGQALDTRSHGILSSGGSEKRADTVEAIRRAQVLAVDEAHNFLNPGAVRTRTLYANMADHVLLFTATPINRGAEDLLPIIDLLGGDNFDEAVIAAIEKVWRRKRRGGVRMSPDERQLVSAAVSRFTVRRTKRMLNSAVDQDPERYKNALGEYCRYPEHNAHLYRTGETEDDRAVAKEIRAVAGELKGVGHFKKRLRLPEFLAIQGWTDDRYLAWRLSSAAALSAHGISSALRSSRAALVEHLLGTEAAAKRFDLEHTGKSASSGNIISSVAQLAGTIPSNELSCDVPEWLRDPDAHREACEREIKLYRRIEELVHTLSPSRDVEKASLLMDLIREKQRVLAFDRHPITLASFTTILAETAPDAHVILATGSRKAAKKKLERVFALDSRHDGAVALCSDALAEGINLQGAPVLVHLDMPSVIRLAEQRIGRIDRMDSRHESVDVYWPDDSAEFALRADEVFLTRHREVADLLGSNVPLPDGMKKGKEERLDPKLWIRKIEEFAAKESTWDGIRDVFEPVRGLLEGENALVPENVYRTVRHSEARVLSAVSVVTAPEEWSFYAVGGSDRTAPRWVYLEPDAESPVVDLHEVVARLRDRLQAGVASREHDEQAARRLSWDMDRLRNAEMLLIPKKKQRAISEMIAVLGRYLKDSSAEEDPERHEVLRYLLDLSTGTAADISIDLRALADWWLDVIRPVWHAHLSTRRRRPALLKEIRKELEADPISTGQLRTIEDVDLWTQPISERVVAAIVAIAPAPV